MVGVDHPNFFVENHQPDTVSTRVTVDNRFSLAYCNSSFAAYRAASSIWLHENSQYQTHPYFVSSPYLPSFSKPLIQTIGPQSDLRQCPRLHHIKLEYVFNQGEVFNSLLFCFPNHFQLQWAIFPEISMAGFCCSQRFLMRSSLKIPAITSSS